MQQHQDTGNAVWVTLDDDVIQEISQSARTIYSSVVNSHDFLYL